MTDAAETRGDFGGPVGSLAWRRIGDGPPLVLINGYAATVDDWDPSFLAALSEHSSVICPENRGMGESALGSEPVTVAAMAADVVALLDHLGIDEAAVAGWSMGGFVAQQLALSARDRVSHLILMATDPGGPAAIHCEGEVWRRLTDRSGTPREQATRLLGVLFPPDFAAVVDREFGEVVAAARSRLDPAALDAQEEAMAGWAAKPEFERPVQRIMAMAGSLDVVIPPENAATLAGPDGRPELFDGAGHAFMAQEPARSAALTAEFLGR